MASAAGKKKEDKPKTEEDEKMELLEKLKQASKAPEQAAMRIRALDSMIKKLKQNRLNCQVAIDEDEEKLKWIEKKEKDIHVRLDPLAERLKEREETAERIRKQIEQAVEQFGGLLNTTNKRITRTRLKAAGHRKTQATSELRASRGFSAARDDQPYKQKPKGFIDRRR